MHIKYILVSLSFFLLLISCTTKQKTVIEYSFPEKQENLLCLKGCLSDKNSCVYKKENRLCKNRNESKDHISCNARYYAIDCSKQYKSCYIKCGGIVRERVICIDNCK